MTTIKAADAHTTLSELLDRLERGEEILITRRGKAVATLVASGPTEQKVGRIDFAAVHAIAERFRASAREPFSAADINDTLYDADGLPR